VRNLWIEILDRDGFICLSLLHNLFYDVNGTDISLGFLFFNFILYLFIYFFAFKGRRVLIIYQVHIHCTKHAGYEKLA
jgi:hypothetical protein